MDRRTVTHRDEIGWFKAQVEAQTSLRDLATFFTAATRPYGIDTYAIAHLRGAGPTAGIYLTTWPRLWMEAYAAGGFVAIDPIPAEALITPDTFTLKELIRRRDCADNPAVKAGAVAGYRDGFIVPIHGPGEFRGLVAMIGDRLRMSPTDRPVLATKARQAFATARRLFEQGQKVAALSPREREALMLVSQGLDDAAIGVAMGVTKASAHIYVERAKRRLGAATRAQAVAIAVSEGVL